MKRSKLFLTSLSTLVGLYGVLFLVLIIAFNIMNWSLGLLVIVSIVCLALQFLFAPFFMDLEMKWFYGVKFKYELPENLKEYINELCTNYKVKYPKIGYIDDGSPNIFSYGRTKKSARIIITRGIFELLSEEEVKAVVSHEFGHVTHYDMFLMTAVQIVPLLLYCIYENSVSLSDDDDKGKAAILGVIAYVLYVICEYIILWFSRTREYYADEFAVQVTKNPNALAEALVKVGYGLTTNNKNTVEVAEEDNKDKQQKKNAKVASLPALGLFDAKSSKALIVSSYDDGEISKDNIKKAARWELWNPWAAWYEINSTHPMISKRLKAISEMSEEYGQEKYIVFDEQKPESYVDDFLFEVLLKFLPWMIMIITIVVCLLMYNKVAPVAMGCYIATGFLFIIVTFMLLYKRSHKNKNYKQITISELLSEVKVSGVTSVPCIIEGELIGKGDPGCIFNEDFVLRDETGIIFLDYDQPFNIFNVLFALFKQKKYMNKKVVVKGWYRRCPVPYVEIYTITIDGKTKKCHTYGFSIGWFIFFLLMALLYLAVAIMSLI